MANPRIEDLRKRLDKEPQSRLFAQLAEELRKDGDLKEAIRVARDGLEKHPAYASARMTLGRALQDVGDMGGARSEFEAVLTAAPDNILAGRLLAQCLEGLGFLDAALVRYRATLMLSPGDPQLVGRVATLEGRVAGPPVPGGQPVATATPPGAQPVTAQEQEPPEAASGGAPFPLPGEAPEAAVESAFVPEWKPIESAAVPSLPADEEFGLKERYELPDSGRGVRPEAATLPEEAELIPEATASEAQVPLMGEPVAEDFELESPYEASMTSWKGQEPRARDAELVLEGAEREAETPIPLVADSGGEEFELESAYEASMTAWKEPGPAREPELILEGAEREAEAPIPLVADSGGEEFELERSYEASMPTWQAPEPSGEQARDLVSPTLGELYFNQGHTEKAIDVYRRVLEEEPGNDRVRARLMELEAIERALRAEETPEALQSVFGMRGDPRAARREALKRTIARLEDLRAAFRGARP